MESENEQNVDNAEEMSNLASGQSETETSVSVLEQNTNEIETSKLVPEMSSDKIELLESDPEQTKSKKDPKQSLALSKSMDMLKNILESQNDSENKANMPVLPPDHPLMIKYQRDLKTHLLKLHQETDEQIYELNGALKDQSNENDEIGKRNSELQKGLANFKEIISNLNKDFSKISRKKDRMSKKVEAIRETYKTYQKDCQEERHKEVKLQKQIEDLALQIVQLTELQGESFSDSTTVKRAVEKTMKQRENLETEKMRQDIIISRLEADKHNLQDRINLYKSQYAIKKEELADLRGVLAEASTELQSIHLEKKKLLQQWQDSISALEKRDVTCSILRDNIQKYEDDLRSLQMNTISYKKSIRKELEENERLTLQLLHSKSDVSQLEKIIENSRARQLQLQQEQEMFEKIVYNFDIKKEKLSTEKAALENEIEQKSKELEKCYEDQRDLEEERLKIIHEKITFTRTCNHTEQLIRDHRKKIEFLRQKCIMKEGDNGRLCLKISGAEARLESLKNELILITAELKDRENTCAQSEAETTKAHALIVKKQKLLSELNDKLMSLVASAGGQELGPLQREIASFKKDIAISEAERKKVEQDWLKYQRELVKLTNEANEKFREIEVLRKKGAVLEDEKIRMEAKIKQQDQEIKELGRTINTTRKDISRITASLCQGQEDEKQLQKELEMAKSMFLSHLKDEELTFLKKEDKVKELRKERQKCLEQIIETQHEAKLWEQKLCMIEETKKTMKSEKYTKEIDTLNNEIRRLHLKCDKIKSDEEKLARLLETAAFQHASLYVKADIQLLRGQKKNSKQYYITKMARLKKKIENDRKKAKEMQQEIDSKRKIMDELQIEEEKQKVQLNETIEEIKSIEYDIEKKQREKWQNIIKLSFKQKQNRLLQLINENKYIRAIRNENLRAAEIERLRSNLLMIKDIAEDFMKNYPELGKQLFKVMDHITVGLEL